MLCSAVIDTVGLSMTYYECLSYTSLLEANTMGEVKFR